MNNDLISRSALRDQLGKYFFLHDGNDFMEVMRKVEKAPAVDAVEVVRCKDCVTHGNCLTEDTFNIARIENPFCCGGKRRESDATD